MRRIIVANRLVAWLFSLAFIAIVSFVATLQFKEEPNPIYTNISFTNQEIEASRGSIFAMDGQPLSISLPYFRVRIDCKAATDTLFAQEAEPLAKALSSLFKDKKTGDYLSLLKKGRKEGKRYMLLGNRLIDYGEMLQIKEFPLFRFGQNRGGLILEEKNRREKPYGRLAFRTIGYINENGEGVGLEATFNDLLQGKNGIQRVQKLLGGALKPIESENNRPPEDGYNLHTTIDIDIQEVAERAIKEQLVKSDLIEGGTAVVMEVESGAIRAIVNLKKGSRGEYDESYNYALWHSSEPGSIFKLATLAALLEANLVTLDSPIDAGNGKWRYGTYTISDVGRPLGLIDVKEAFANSSNVSFAKLAVANFGTKEREFVDRLATFKIAEPINLDIGKTAATTIYAPGDAMWSKSSLPSMAIGYSVAITPINALTFYNAIANDGKAVKPFFIEKIEREDETLYQHSKEESLYASVCSKQNAATLKEALRGVVEQGTAKSIFDKRYSMGGKTGTARVAIDGKYTDPQGNRKYQASFVGFFPVEKPKYSAIVVIYSAKTKGNFYGGSWSAPVFKTIADNIYAMSRDWTPPLQISKNDTLPTLFAGNNSNIDKLYTLLGKESREATGEWSQLTHQLNEAPLKQIDNRVPNLYSMGLKDALFLAESVGYRVKFEGSGRVVSQTPAPDSLLKKGETLYLKLDN